MCRILPILFNTDMVCAILDEKKTVTRQIVKPLPDWFDCGIFQDRNTPMKSVDATSTDWEIKQPYQTGDILYVRETWLIADDGDYYFKANESETSRIWLKVTNVRVERLQDITIEGCKKEGVLCGGNGDIFAFMKLWDSTVTENYQKWVANPWIWVIEFERCEKPSPCVLANIEQADDKIPCKGYGKSELDDEPCKMCKNCNIFVEAEDESRR